ncbi:MAG: threonylcarbamoyl-AMP synthase [Ruminococcaceae bacterium]|nr:threonylcarbamoyl-AMP synthase [Oscillospiraceae bacterium]
MNTQLLKPAKENIEAAAQILRDGGLVGMPTETVYGLAANALDADAVSSIFIAKGRPSDNPLIVHISRIEEIEKYGLVKEFSKTAKKLADAFWPGPLTIIMPKGESVPSVVTGGLDSVAVRLPSHKVARELIKAAGCPLAAPSANLSGSPSPTTAQHVFEDMNGRIPLIIDGGSSEVGLESTVITLCTETPTVLRPGKVTLEELSSVLGNVNLSDAVLEKLKEGEEAASPGMKYRHYAPKAKVYLVKSDDKKFIDFLNSKDNNSTAALCYNSDTEYLNVKSIPLGDKDDYDSQAHNLFSALRTADTLEGIDTVYVRCPKAQGLGMALFNRLIRAAGFEVITLE